MGFENGTQLLKEEILPKVIIYPSTSTAGAPISPPYDETLGFSVMK